VTITIICTRLFYPSPLRLSDQNLSFTSAGSPTRFTWSSYLDHLNSYPASADPLSPDFDLSWTVDNTFGLMQSFWISWCSVRLAFQCRFRSLEITIYKLSFTCIFRIITKQLITSSVAERVDNFLCFNFVHSWRPVCLSDRAKKARRRLLWKPTATSPAQESFQTRTMKRHAGDRGLGEVSTWMGSRWNRGHAHPFIHPSIHQSIDLGWSWHSSAQSIHPSIHPSPIKSLIHSYFNPSTHTPLIRPSIHSLIK